MKKLRYSLLLIVALLIGFSCTDDSLDPLNIKTVQKGTILALRGDQLQKIYYDGKPGAELFPKIYKGSEKFNFDAEYLSDDPTSLESMDIYVIKKPRAKVFLTNIPFSQFKETSDYPQPWVSVSLNAKDILSKLLDHTPTSPMSADDINTLLTTYATGVNMEVDLNKTDGSKVLASDLVAAGLYQSNQFYPAQRLTYAMTDYCSYDASTWAGTYEAIENYENGAADPYDLKLTQDGTDPNKFHMDNFYGLGLAAYIVFSVSTEPGDQIVDFPDQNTGGDISGTGTYNQCLNKMTINVVYDRTDEPYSGKAEWRYDLVKKP